MRITTGFLLVGASNESGVVDDVIFGDLRGYFFGKFRDKASDAAACRPVIDCKRNDLE